MNLPEATKVHFPRRNQGLSAVVIASLLGLASGAVAQPPAMTEEPEGAIEGSDEVSGDAPATFSEDGADGADDSSDDASDEVVDSEPALPFDAGSAHPHPPNAPEPEPEPASEEPAPETPEVPDRHRFVFGSYGRVVAASNLDGGLGRSTNIASYGPRIDEDVYAEIELRREDQLAPGVWSRVVATLALSGPLFHLDGDFDEQLAVRNLFAEVDGALAKGLSLWAGSRMVRGDDVYLLNWWPLDNLNIVGGGGAYRFRDLLSFRFHVGIGRPNDPFYLQTRDVVARRGFEPERISILDRPRVVSALRSTITPIQSETFGMKIVLYAEVHTLGSGERMLENGTVQQLPRDGGYLVGAQLGLWNDRRAEPGPTGPHTERSFVNLFARYARGLAAYNTFDAPFRAGSGVESDGASESLVALSANYERAFFGIQAGAYYRHFRDANTNAFGGGVINEGAINLRPQFFFGDFAGVSLDASYQALALSTLDERTGEAVRGGVTKLGIIPFVSLGGRGTYARPRLRLIYAMTRRDEGARALYPDADPRSQQTIEHFAGIGAEWWFDSTSYSQ